VTFSCSKQLYINILLSFNFLTKIPEIFFQLFKKKMKIVLEIVENL